MLEREVTDRPAGLITTKILAPIISRQIIKDHHHRNYKQKANKSRGSKEVSLPAVVDAGCMHLHTGDVCAITIHIVIPLTCMNSVIKGFCCRQRHFNRGVKGSRV